MAIYNTLNAKPIEYEFGIGIQFNYVCLCTTEIGQHKCEYPERRQLS